MDIMAYSHWRGMRKCLCEQGFCLTLVRLAHYEKCIAIPQISQTPLAHGLGIQGREAQCFRGWGYCGVAGLAVADGLALNPDEDVAADPEICRRYVRCGLGEDESVALQFRH